MTFFKTLKTLMNSVKLLFKAHNRKGEIFVKLTSCHEIDFPTSSITKFLNLQDDLKKLKFN